MSAVASGRNRSARSGVERRGPRRTSASSASVAARVVAPVDEPEQHGERVVEVGAGLRRRRGQLDEHELAEPVEAVALARTRARRPAARRARATPRRRAGTGCGRGTAATAWPAAAPRSAGSGSRPRPGAAAHDLVGDDLDGQRARPRAGPCETPTVCLTDSSSDAAPPDVALGVGRERLGREAGRARGRSRRRACVVVALADELQVDGEVAALGPALALGDEQPSGPASTRANAGAVVGDEQRARAAARPSVTSVVSSSAGSYGSTQGVARPSASRSSTVSTRRGVDDDERRRLVESGAARTNVDRAARASVLEPPSVVAEDRAAARALSTARASSADRPRRASASALERGRGARRANRDARRRVAVLVVARPTPCGAASTRAWNDCFVGVGGEVVLADPVLADDDRVATPSPHALLRGRHDDAAAAAPAAGRASSTRAMRLLLVARVDAPLLQLARAGRARRPRRSHCRARGRPARRRVARRRCGRRLRRRSAMLASARRTPGAMQRLQRVDVARPAPGLTAVGVHDRAASSASRGVACGSTSAKSGRPASGTRPSRYDRRHDLAAAVGQRAEQQHGRVRRRRRARRRPRCGRGCASARSLAQSSTGCSGPR